VIGQWFLHLNQLVATVKTSQEEVEILTVSANPIAIPPFDKHASLNKILNAECHRDIVSRHIQNLPYRILGAVSQKCCLIKAFGRKPKPLPDIAVGYQVGT
jgi:hypothetical protein